MNVLNLFFELKEDSWHRDSLDLIIHEYQSNKEANSKGGKKSALNRKKKLADNSSLSVLQLTSNHKLLTINQEPEINKEETLTNIQLTDDLLDSESLFLEEFEEFWNTYPRKIGKEAARKEWLRLKPDLEKVKKSLGWQRSCKEWTSDDGRYIPYPSKYLTEQRWEDERKKDFWEGGI